MRPFLFGVVDDNTQYYRIDKEEDYARYPESWNKGRMAVELELEALLKPRNLAYNPEDERRDADRRRLEKSRVREVIWEEHHVPEEVLEGINVETALMK